MNLEMKVGSCYYNKPPGMLTCYKYEDGVYVVVNKTFMYDVDAYGKDCTKFPNAEYDLEYECDEYGNEVYGLTKRIVQDKQEQRKHNHYFKDVSNLNEIDVYAVLTLFEVHDPCIAHAAKKLLCTGNRGHKDFETDVQDAIDSLVRWKELNKQLK